MMSVDPGSKRHLHGLIGLCMHRAHLLRLAVDNAVAHIVDAVTVASMQAYRWRSLLRLLSSSLSDSPPVERSKTHRHEPSASFSDFVSSYYL